MALEKTNEEPAALRQNRMFEIMQSSPQKLVSEYFRTSFGFASQQILEDSLFIGGGGGERQVRM